MLISQVQAFKVIVNGKILYLNRKISKHPQDLSIKV